jgi:hypothetical protein
LILHSRIALAIGEEEEISAIPRMPNVILNGRGPISKNIIAAPARQNKIPMTTDVMNIHLVFVGAFIGPSCFMLKRSVAIKIGFVVGPSYYHLKVEVGNQYDLLERGRKPWKNSDQDLSLITEKGKRIPYERSTLKKRIFLIFQNRTFSTLWGKVEKFTNLL